jgi:mRNA interferase MazF
MVIAQGDIFWADLGTPRGSGPGCLRPVVVLQNNTFNNTRISTVFIAILTSNVALAQRPGNVLLRAGEANLTKPSVVNISQLFSVDKTDLMDYIGSLSPQRIREVIGGVHLLIDPS